MRLINKTPPIPHALTTRLAIAAAAVLAIALSPAMVRAEHVASAAPHAQRVSNAPIGQPAAIRPSIPRLPTPRLNPGDRMATLEALQFALMEVGDGATFVWHKRQGQLHGIVRPTSSFRNAEGRICRHLILALELAGYQKRMEGIACRTGDGSWSLSG